MEVIVLQESDYDETLNRKNDPVDPAFKKICKGIPTFVIFRIEALKVVQIPKEEYGHFYDSDSYIVYAAGAEGQVVSTTGWRDPRGVPGKIKEHLHFWLGSETTQDKSGVAAYKSVELDNYLGNTTTQHREVQGNESPRFKSYFKDGFTVLHGGTPPGFTHVTGEYLPRLFRIKGKRRPVMTQMKSISWSHFNSGDIFILDTKKIVFVWCGHAANTMEKLQGTKIANKLKDEHNARAVVFVDDGYEQTMHDQDRDYFNKFLDLENREVKPADSVETDEAAETAVAAGIKLYQCSDADGGKYRITEVKGGPILQNDLKSEDVWILDHGPEGIWVWVGKQATDQERSEAMRNARGFVKKKNYPANTPVHRILDGGEPVEFKMLFSKWTDKYETKGLGKMHVIGKIAKIVPSKFDAKFMHSRPKLAAEVQLVDDGSGDIRVWRLNRVKLVEIPLPRYGIFFDEDCYIVWYNYQTTTGSKYIIYYWQGLHAHREERGAAALRTIEKDDETGGIAVQVRTVQGKEPPHFLQLFRGKMIVFSGRGIDFDPSGQNMLIPKQYLLQITGNTTYNTRAVEVPFRAASLNTNDCFVLKKGVLEFIWCGNHSTGDEREMAKKVSTGDAVLVLEGKESDTFWKTIGGSMPYFITKALDDKGDPRPPRLFQCSTASGNFKAEEILYFTQTDLIPEDVMLLDAYDTLFVWVGLYSTDEERRLSMVLAAEYLNADPSGRDPHTPIVKVKQGIEPPNFTGFFGAWDYKLWEKYKTYQDLRQEYEEARFSKGGPQVNGFKKSSQGSNELDKYNKYSLNILKGDVTKLPPTVDPKKKELHLTHDDFLSVFKQTYDDFVKLPEWRQKDIKKKVGLF